MIKFRDSWLLAKSWKLIVTGGNTNRLYNNTDIFSLQQKMFHFLDSLIQHYYHKTTITKCAELAIKRIEEFESCSEIDGIEMTISPKTILKWYKMYIVNSNFPSSKKSNGKSSLPHC